MVRHLVLVRFREEISQETKTSVFNQLAVLKSQIDGMIDFQCGPNTSPETELLRGYHDLFWVDFASESARDHYLSHPAHVAAGTRLVEHLQGGRDGIVVADLSIADSPVNNSST